ncbi:MAG TPA: IclR family transcriptional regulator [Terriglobales bacterium]|nr:IclR family transcriptional regulator [Terriglobales bacterium]
MTVPHRKTRRQNKSPYQIQVLDRALAVLKVLSQEGPDLTLAQVSSLLHLHKSTAHRLIMVLEGHKLIERNSKNGTYRLGMKLFELGTRAVSQLDLRERARPILERLVRDTDETVHLCVYDNGEVVYVDKVEPARSVRLASTVGRRHPAFCTAVGKSMMAVMPEEQIEAAVHKHGLRPLTRKTIGSLSELKSELAKVRKLGYAVDNEENEEGVCCVGAVVRNASGDPVAAISVSGPSFRLPAYKIPIVAKSVIAAANVLSEDLGYHDSLESTEEDEKRFKTVRPQLVNA